MYIKELAQAVVGSLSDDLRRAPWRGSSNPVAGHGYVASEALFHLGLRDVGFRPMFLRVGDFAVSHWFLSGVEVLDVTVAQFDVTPDYTEARCRSFLTSFPSKRARTVMCRVSDLTTMSYDDIVLSVVADFRS